MSSRSHIGLDNPAFYGRLRQDSGYVRRQPARRTPAPYSQIIAPAELVVPAQQAVVVPTELSVVEAQPYAQPARVKQQPSTVLRRQFSEQPPHAMGMSVPLTTKRSRFSRPQVALLTMAGIVFSFGIFVSLQTLLTNHAASAQVAALSHKVDTQATTGASNSDVPSISKPLAADIANYTVAADLARYLDIPKLSVHARVLQEGIQKNGALAVPWNIFDTGWYTGSAKPGQPGATLIDGHVAAWTTPGSFYNLHTLQAGDQIQITLGSGATLTYQVVKTQVYPADNVDMQAAMTPVTPGVSGLNLITCTGHAEKGTNNYDQRVVVFAQEVSS